MRKQFLAVWILSLGALVSLAGCPPPEFTFSMGVVWPEGSQSCKVLLYDLDDSKVMVTTPFMYWEEDRPGDTSTSTVTAPNTIPSGHYAVTTLYFDLLDGLGDIIDQESDNLLLDDDGNTQLDPLHTFWWYYQFDPKPGNRYWSQIGGEVWVERYYDGTLTFFAVQERSVLDSVEGTIVRRINAQGETGIFDVFIPDMDEPTPHWARFRHGGAGGAWQTMGEIQYTS